MRRNRSKMIKGKACKFGDNVNTDEIIAAKYLNLAAAQELGKHCMETIDPQFPKKISPGDIIVAGDNFGCGSSREHAPIAIKGAGISCVIAKSFARIFFRNCINIGLPILEIRETDEIKAGDTLEIDLPQGIINNVTQNKTYQASAFPEFMQEIMQAGGLMGWVRKKL